MRTHKPEEQTFPLTKRQEFGQIVMVCGLEQGFGRAADAQPCEVRKGAIRRQCAAWGG